MNDSQRLSRVEFIALIAMLFATIAFSIDSMLPALPEIALELSPQNANRAQLVLTSFVFGMGIGTFFTGPLSDAFGRKPVVLGGAVLYIFGALLGYFAEGVEMILMARVMQGLGAAAPRIVGLAIVRDLYSGREMARIMSFAMMIFTLVPAIAPLLGSGIIALIGWRGIFLAFVVFALISNLWLSIRQPESLPLKARRPLKLSLLGEAIMEMFNHPSVRLSILAQTFTFSVLFMSISLIQPIFDTVFDRAATFPLWFAGMALLSGTGSLLNAALVVRVGMRKLASIALGSQAVFATTMTLVWLVNPQGSDMVFYAFMLWITTVFFQTGLTLGNLNAITMEPMGHIAGTAASVSGGVATVCSALIAAPVGLAFNGTPVPLTIGAAVAAFLAWLTLYIMMRVERRQDALLS